MKRLEDKRIDTNVLIECSEANRKLVQKEDKCDKYDYLIAVACGVVGGLVDVFAVGAPGNSTIEKFTDNQIDSLVKKSARMMGWSPRPEKEENMASAIQFLERKYRVNYDQTSAGSLFNMSTKNHHMKNLAHSPDIVGLFFSVLNQFTSTSTFIANGQLITINTETFELQGGNIIAKIFAGIANWLGHIMSDIAGSNGSRGNGGRGTGIVIPFYELFGFCKFGKFNVDKDKQDLATIATRAFQQGYDFRFGLATAIPVVITELLIRLIWGLRQRFQYGKPLNECIPTQKHADLRVMLIFGNGTLCVIDGLDAGIRSGGNFLTFFMRLNLIAWFRFVTLVLKEVLIRVGIASPLQKYIEAYKRVNEALLVYLSELEQIDIEAFKRETEEYNNLVKAFEKTDTLEGLNVALLEIFDKNGISKPWQGDFDEHMSDKNATLVFE